MCWDMWSIMLHKFVFVTLDRVEDVVMFLLLPGCVDILAEIIYFLVIKTFNSAFHLGSSSIYRVEMYTYMPQLSIFGH